MTSGSKVVVVEHDLTPALADGLRGARRVACDTETSGLDWRADRLGVVQLYAPDVGAVIIRPDPVRPQRLCDLLADPSVLKVFHHAPFDLRFLATAWGVGARAIRCTKVASKLLRPTADNAQHSLGHLLKEVLDVDVDKGATRISDWLAGILSPDQLAYAVADVVHLLPLLDRLEADLHDVGRDDLYESCCSFLPARVELDVGGFPEIFAY